MPITPSDLLDLAQDLAGGSSEVRYRAAASRAYYAAFHGCTPIQKRISPAPDRPKTTHAALIKDLRTYAGKESGIRGFVRQLAARMANARRIRGAADYRIAEEFDKSNAEQIILSADRILRDIQRLDLSKL